MTSLWVGIDPGKTGALAVLTADELEVYDWVDGPTMAEILSAIKSGGREIFAALERVNAMPKQGVSSTFKFGKNYGQWIGMLDALGIPFVEVRPQDWQKGLVPKKINKSDKPSLTVARRLYPTAELNLQKHHGRADALLIARWAMNQQR